MDEGISFYEACELTPEGLTAQQLQNCPKENVASPSYLYVGAGVAILLIVIIIFIIIKSRFSAKSS